MLLWGIFDVLPALIMYTDIFCNNDTSIARGQKGICTFHRGTVHLLQAAYYWMTAAIIDLWMSIVCETQDRVRQARGKVIMGLASGIPLVMAIFTYTAMVNDADSLQIDFDGQGGIDYPNRVWNESKDFFTCSPRLRYFLEEVLSVHVHFVIGAMLMIPMLAQICSKLIKSSFKTSSAGASLGQKIQGAFKKSGSKKLVIMGTMVTFLLILQLIAIANIFPKMEEFAEAFEVFDSCTYGEGATYLGDPCLDTFPATCCDFLDPSKNGKAPDSLLMAFGYYFPASTISLVYALVCVQDQGHKTVWRQMLGLKGGKTLPSGSTASSQSSTY